MRSVSDGQLCMCACHTNHSVGCIKERIRLPVRKLTNVNINLEMCQITVVCLIKHFTFHRFNSAVSETFQVTKKITLARLACLCFRHSSQSIVLIYTQKNLNLSILNYPKSILLRASVVCHQGQARTHLLGF